MADMPTSCYSPAVVASPPGDQSNKPLHRVPSLKNIFKPRRDVYDKEELLFLANLAPITRLPGKCYPKLNSKIQPPLFLKGWLIDTPEMTKQAVKRGLEYFVLRKQTNPQTGEIEMVKAIDDVRTFSEYVDAVLEEVNVTLPVEDPIDLAWAPHPDPSKLYAQPMFVIYDNYTVGHRPAKEDIEKVRDALGSSLKGDIQYFANAGLMQWTYQ